MEKHNEIYRILTKALNEQNINDYKFNLVYVRDCYLDTQIGIKYKDREENLLKILVSMYNSRNGSDDDVYVIIMEECNDVNIKFSTKQLLGSDKIKFVDIYSKFKDKANKRIDLLLNEFSK